MCHRPETLHAPQVIITVAGRSSGTDEPIVGGALEATAQVVECRCATSETKDIGVIVEIWTAVETAVLVPSSSQIKVESLVLR